MATATTITATTTTTTTTATTSSSTRHQTQQQQQQQQQLLPPLSVKPSISMQPEDSVFSRLGATPLPDKEINAILNLHENLSLSQVLAHFDACMDKMTRWLETAQMAVFTLELQLKEGSTNELFMLQQQQQQQRYYYDDYENDHLLELAFGRMEPLISILVEVGNILEDKLDMEEEEDDDDDGNAYNNGGGSGNNTKKMHTRMSITKVQSEWSGLQHFMSSVLKQLDTMNEKKELTLLMENVLQQIDDLSIMMFRFQEKRHAAAAAGSNNTSTNGITTYPLDTQNNDVMGSPISTTSSLFSPSTTTTTTTATGTTVATSVISSINTTSHNNNEPIRDEHILAEIDSKVEPLFNDVQRIYASMTSHSPPEDPSGMLTRKHHMVQHRWEALRIEIDDLKEELKEDRWLTVFRQVADQVDVMIDGLDKTVTQCYTIIDQAREWYHATYQQQQQSSSSQGNAFNRFSKSIMRSFPRHHQSSSSSTTTTANSTSTTTSPPPPPPVDREKFRSVEKNFEAKYKYYTPSIGKMLGMLGSGIVSRVARDNGTSKRHAAMMQRWTTLKTSMDTLRNKDLPETERMLSEPMHTPNSPGGWKSIRYKSPEPTIQQGEALLRAKSANNNTLPKTNFSARGYNHHYQHHYQHEQEDYRRAAGVRSVTPSGNRMFHSKVTQQQQQQQYHPPRAASSMAYACRDIRPSASESSSLDSYPLSGVRKTMTPIGSSHHESRSFATTNRKSRVPGGGGGTTSGRNSNGEDKEEASWMKPTKSTLLRTARRAQSVDQGMRERSESPSRPKTPVQRSKTPNPGYTRRKSTTPNVPSRPKSSLGRQQQQQQQQQQLTVPNNNNNNDYYYNNHQDVHRSVSPIPRRTMTPSLIPRPKTPSSSTLRCASPSLIPRPRSSMQHNHPPPLPPIPASFHQDQYQPSLKKKQSMPALMHRTTSPFRMTHVPMRAPSPQYQRRRRLSEDGNDFSLIRGHHHHHHHHHHPRHEVYTPNPKDPLDMEVARIVNASPISVKCQKGPLGGGRYFFGNELNPSVGGGKKLYTCKLMTYENNTQRRSKAAHPPQNKVLVRVGGGWQDLEMFLLDHSNLMTATTTTTAAASTITDGVAVVSRFK